MRGEKKGVHRCLRPSGACVPPTLDGVGEGRGGPNPGPKHYMDEADPRRSHGRHAATGIRHRIGVGTTRFQRGEFRVPPSLLSPLPSSPPPPPLPSRLLISQKICFFKPKEQTVSPLPAAIRDGGGGGEMRGEGREFREAAAFPENAVDFVYDP